MSRLSSAKFYTSELSQFCDQHLGFDFHFFDKDHIILHYASQPITYARSTNILRFLESKRPGEEIRRSQREVMPILSHLVHLGVQHGVIGGESGVFILEGEAPYNDGATLKTVLPTDTKAAGLQLLTRELSRTGVDALVRCRPVADEPLEKAA